MVESYLERCLTPSIQTLKPENPRQETMRWCEVFYTCYWGLEEVLYIGCGSGSGGVDVDVGLIIER